MTFQTYILVGNTHSKCVNIYKVQLLQERGIRRITQYEQ